MTPPVRAGRIRKNAKPISKNVDPFTLNPIRAQALGVSRALAQRAPLLNWQIAPDNVRSATSLTLLHE